VRGIFCRNFLSRGGETPAGRSNCIWNKKLVWFNGKIHFPTRAISSVGRVLARVGLEAQKNVRCRRGNCGGAARAGKRKKMGKIYCHESGGVGALSFRGPILRRGWGAHILFLLLPEISFGGAGGGCDGDRGRGGP